jgi:hypothetical protein
MPIMNRNNAVFSAALTSFALGILLLGCGSDGSSNAESDVDFSGNSLAKCLRDNGAKFATDAGELDFFSSAEADDSASMFATYLDRPTKLFVQQWKDGEDPREWLLWQAQPFNKDKTPIEIVDSPSSESYVAYAKSPSRSQKQSLEACTGISG